MKRKEGYTHFRMDVLRSIGDATALSVYAYLKSVMGLENSSRLAKATQHLARHFFKKEKVITDAIEYLREKGLIEFSEIHNQDGSFGDYSITLTK